MSSLIRIAGLWWCKLNRIILLSWIFYVLKTDFIYFSFAVFQSIWVESLSYVKLWLLAMYRQIFWFCRYECMWTSLSVFELSFGPLTVGNPTAITSLAPPGSTEASRGFNSFCGATSLFRGFVRVGKAQHRILERRGQLNPRRSSFST